MNTDLQKRIEEAANEHAEKHGFRVPYDGSNNFYDETDVKASKDGFLTGAEQGYKEAIAQAKEWIGDICEKVGFSNKTVSQCVESFESYMNKFWEERK